MNHTEKRRHPRIALRTSALLFDRRRQPGEWGARSQALGSFSVVDVSVGGALIDGDLPLPVGTPLGVHLRLPGTLVQMGSVVVRREKSAGKRSSFALCFEIVPMRDQEVVKRLVVSSLAQSQRPAGRTAAPRGYQRTESDPEGYLMTPSGAAWHTLRELEAVHAQRCDRCQEALADPAASKTESCKHGRDLRCLLRALTLVLADPTQYPRVLVDCRALAIGWLGRELDARTREVLKLRLDAGSALALSGRRPERRFRFQLARAAAR